MKAGVMTFSCFLASIRTRSFEFMFRKPYPRKKPSQSRTLTMEPFSAPSMVWISLS